MSEVVNCTLFNFVVWGILGGILCLFGYVGNTLSVVALQRDVRSATTTLLQALAVSDLVLLVSVAVTDATPYICDYTLKCLNPWVSWPQVRYVWLLTPVAHMCSIWLVVLVAANRYWAVCRPHTVGTVWTPNRTVVYVIGVIVVVIAINSPRLFEYRMEVFELPLTSCGTTKETVITSTDIATLTNINGDINTIVGGLEPEAAYTVGYNVVSDPSGSTLRDYVTCNSSQTVKQVREVKSWLGASHWYRFVYKSLFVSIALVLLPILTLILLSVFIIRALKRTQSYRMSQKQKQKLHPNERTTLYTDGAPEQQPSPHDDRVGRLEQIRRQSRSTIRRLKTSLTRDESRTSRGNSASAGSASREITFVLVTVVLVAVICQSPLAVFHCVRYVVPASTLKCGHTVFYLETAAKVLVNINSCANFVIYCLLSPKFRSRLLEAITCRPRTHLGSKHAGTVMASAPEGTALPMMNVRNAQTSAVPNDPV